MKSIMFKNIAFLIALAALPISESLAAAGKFNFVIGDVSVIGASGSRKAVRGGEVEANESIVSGKDGMAQLRMSDGAFIAVRSDTELRIDKYKFSGKADASSESVLSLVKGTFRAFTGAIASFNKDKFKMKTPSATIGIRGSGNVLNFSPTDNVTLNHTIEGSHVVTAFDPSGALRTLVTMPGQTVQINAVGAMQLVQTPTFILNAAAGVPDSKPQQQPRQQQNQQPGAGGQGQAPGQGGAPGEGGGAAAGGPGMPGAPGVAVPGMMPRAGGMRAPGMPGMYAEGAEGAGDPAMTGKAPGQTGMYNPAMPGGAPAIDPATGMPMAPAPGMYGAAPMPGMYPPAPGMPGTYGAPTIDPATGMYGAVPMPGIYPPAAGMPYTDPVMMAPAPGMYGAAPMPGMYPTAGMPYSDPVMMAPAPGMYVVPAPLPGMGMYDPAMPMAPAPGVYGAAPMPGMYPTASMPYNDPAMMGMYAPAPSMYAPAPMPGMYAPAPATYNPAMPTGTTYTTYDPMTGMTMTTYVPPPTTYIAQYGYDAMGNLLPGYVLINGIPTLQTSAPYGYQYDFYGNLVLMPGFAVDIYGNAYPTGATVRFGFDAGGFLMPGYSMDAYGNAYPSWNPPGYGYTYDYYGNLVLAPGFTRDMYGNPVMGGAAAGAVGWIGGPCSGYSAPGGAYCDPATNTFMSVGGTTYAFGWLGGPCAGYSAPAGMVCDFTTNTFVNSGTAGGAVAGTMCYGYGTVSGSLYCDGMYWTTPAVGTPCTGAATVGGLYCNGATWMAMAGGAAAGTACSGVGTVSGSLYCNGAIWTTPVVGGACGVTGLVVGGFTCSGGIWGYTGGGGAAVAGTACYSTGAVSGSLYCDGWYWMYPSQGGYCTGAVTVGNLSCVANIWTAGAMAGTACSTQGAVSGSLYCDGWTWITPAVDTYCYSPGTVVGNFTCSGGLWSSNVAMLGGACTGTGSISGPYTCDGVQWVQAGSWCATNGATAGGLTCSANIWSFTGGATAGSPCTAPGTISGSLYCDGGQWLNPVVSTACSYPGMVVGNMTCSAGFWSLNSGAMLGGACIGWGTQSGGFTCDGTVWVGDGSYCGSPGSILGPLYCDASYMWTTPTLGWACTGTATVGAFTCSGGQWVAAGGATLYGACFTAGQVSGGLTCDGAMWITTPSLGAACTGNTGLNGLVCAGVWMTPAMGYPAFSAYPGPNAIYDAFGVIQPVVTYRNIGYMYNLSGWNNFEIALNSAANVIEGTGGLLSFQKPAIGAMTSLNSDQLDRLTATALDFGTDPGTGMSWGRWAGGTISQIAIGGTPTGNTPQTGSLHWFATSGATQQVMLPTTGTWSYAKVGNTSPTDNAGTVGALTGATFSANFSAQTVNVGLTVNMPASPVASFGGAVQLNANAMNVPIMPGGNFKDIAPSVTCGGSGCASPVGGGVIGGQFSAPTGQAVGVGYGLVNGGQTVNGAAVFKQQ